MAIYVVMEPAGGSSVASERAVFVRDGFHAFAFLVPVVWMLWHRLWIEAALVLAATLAVGAAAELAGVPVAGGVATFFLSVWAGLEGPALRVAALRRRGWTEAGAIEAESLDEAETRYMFDAADMEAAPVPAAFPAPRALPAMPHSGPALGLMAYPDRR